MARAKLTHVVRAVVGEPGRYWVDSHSFPGEWYIVDVLEVEPTNAGHIRGTCGCKGWSVRKSCSHLDDARDYHETKNEREPLPVPARPKQ